MRGGHPGAVRARGSVLVLVPAGILVVVVLAALAVDLAHVHLVQRRLHTAAAAAANDAVTAGLDEARFRATGAYGLDPARVERSVRDTIAAQGDRVLDHARVQVRAGSADVSVRLEVRVDHLFAPAVPGSPRSVDVSATATARAAVR